MRDTALVTEADLARAREDPVFRQQLVADYLELLIGQLNKLRALGADFRASGPESATGSIWL